MSKDNMEELQRWENDLRYGNPLSRAEDGEWVRFSDVQEREARFQARIEELAQDRDDMTDTILGLRERIEELEVIVSGKTMYDAAAVADARWREHIEGAIEVELERYKREIETSEMWPANDPNFDWEHVRVPHLRSAGDAISRVYALRSLLDSGEEQKASEPAIYEGYGRKWERVKGTSALREVGDTGPDWDQCVYHMIGGRVQRFLMAEREARPSPSPALEGREDEGTYRRDPDGCYVCGVDEYAARARGRAEAGLSPSNLSQETDK